MTAPMQPDPLDALLACGFCGHHRREHREFNYFTKRPDRSCVASGLTLNGYAHTDCSCEAFTEVTP